MADTEQENKFEKALERLAQQQQQLLEKQESLLKQISENQKPLRKDIWDRLGAIAPILSGTIIALGGTYFTLAYNQQQLKLQEAQTGKRGSQRIQQTPRVLSTFQRAESVLASQKFAYILALLRHALPPS